MKDIKNVVGSKDICKQPLQPYSDEVLNFIEALSDNLMSSPMLRVYPDVTALAFWCRKANLQKMKKQYPEITTRLGRGLCFHIAPGNIPINFMFSYLFGALSGCANLVRLPSKEFPQTKFICELLDQLFPEHPEVQKRTAFIRYAADMETTALYCREADARMIWGGDATIEAIKHLPAKPRCVDIAFADRYSICILDGDAVLSAQERVITRLAENFFNDTYLMDQNACSSPQLLLWFHDSKEGRKRFWDAVISVAEKRYTLQAAVSVEKYTKMCMEAVTNSAVAEACRSGNLLYRMELSYLPDDLTVLRGRGGYFYEYGLKAYEELLPCITEKYQTITYFGVKPEEIRRFVIENCLRGIDRIVPIGKAMDIGIIWDGYDLIRMLSRIVSME